MQKKKKTWGHVHKVQCKLEACRQYGLVVLRSGLTLSECEHIRSLEDCSISVTEECVEGEVLTFLWRG